MNLKDVTFIQTKEFLGLPVGTKWVYSQMNWFYPEGQEHLIYLSPLIIEKNKDHFESHLFININ